METYAKWSLYSTLYHRKAVVVKTPVMASLFPRKTNNSGLFHKEKKE